MMQRQTQIVISVSMKDTASAKHPRTASAHVHAKHTVPAGEQPASNSFHVCAVMAPAKTVNENDNALPWLPRERAIVVQNNVVAVSHVDCMLGGPILTSLVLQKMRDRRLEMAPAHERMGNKGRGR